ncbi:flavodoxin [Veronia nyctiphanis]|uniref:Flavodoxin n=1 Tax=Veronia nyctiphanis TaxID=1278244 RepID=A0A4Q0YNR8_9GAMM|nr:hybrid-cluster NAD(P)-dependent oxidoreductase [Veronia nyctiphanis]RXJ71594.1 flavodoxin [Veronia nyctiphanis]
MSKAVVSDIFVYPVKSGGSINLSQSWVEKEGLSFDRRFMIAETSGKMLTGRTSVEIPQITITLQPDGLTFTHPTMSPLILKYSTFAMDTFKTGVWDDEFEGFTTTSTADAWLSHLIGKSVKLLYTGEKSPRHGSKAKVDVSFADAFPLLLISEASLEALNDRAPEPVSMSQFRTNLVVKGTKPFEEDSWAKIKIGQVEFKVDCPCSRCVFTTLDVDAGIYHPKGEPITTLSKFRTDGDGNVNFGMNIVALNEGVISADDDIEVLEYRDTEVYEDNTTPKSRLVCEEREEVAKDFMTFWLKPENGDVPEYKAGQHLPIDFSINGNIVQRRYTLSSSPTRPDRLSISVKRVEGGLVSNWLHDHFQVESGIKAQLPSGDFHLDDAPEKRQSLLFLSAGSGVTPMVSMLRSLADRDQVNDVVFFHQCRSEEDIPFISDLNDIAERYPSLKIMINLTQPSVDWVGMTGRLDQGHLSAIPDLQVRETFVCGPQGFMESAMDLLKTAGVAESQLHQEFFASPEVKNDEVSKPVGIQIDGEYVRGDNQRVLLTQAEEAGLNLPYSCRAGVCGTCKVKLVSGEVEQPDMPGLMPGESDDGMILACCCVPKTDIEVITL